MLRIKRKFIYFSIYALFVIVLHGWYLFGPQILYLLLFTFIVSTVAELVSLKTPIRCFGVKYWYHINHPFFSSKVRFLGVYPVEISLAWVILKYVSFSLAILITQAFHLPQLIMILLTPLILVSLDFIIDPISVNMSKLWQWEKGSAYFGIPLRNFLGWYAVGLVATLIYSSIEISKNLKFNILYLLPIILYAMFLRNVPLLFKYNKKMAIIGSIPTIVWTFLSLISLFLIISRKT